MSLFITFEGPDGSGKSTQIKLLTDYLQNRGFDVLQTREPGGTAIGNQIRDIVHDVANTEMSSHAEVLLYSASRAQLVEQLILPHLAQGGAVICDRYADSTYAYQGYGRQLDFDMLQRITRFATQALTPDITIYLDVDVDTGLKRKQQANTAGDGEWNRMDQLARDFHQRVRAGYLEMSEAEPKRWLVIDASGSVADVQRKIRDRLGQMLKQGAGSRE